MEPESCFLNIICAGADNELHDFPHHLGNQLKIWKTRGVESHKILVQGETLINMGEQPLILFRLDKFVNGVVSIVLSFIDMQELMFVNVYMSYKSSIDILP